MNREELKKLILVGLLFILLLGVTPVIILTQKLTSKNAELEVRLIEQQEQYERTIEIAYYTVKTVEDELKKQQRLYGELTEDYHALVTEKSILEGRLIQAMEDAEGVYTEENIRYAIDIFATYLVEYPPNSSICVYENGTLLVFEMSDDTLIFDEMFSYNELKELWFNK